MLSPSGTVDDMEKLRIDYDVIARVAHETNRAWCAAIGDNSQPPWDDAPQWQRDSARHGVEFHLKSHNEGHGTPPPSSAHDAWLADKLADGWKYGPVKDPGKKEHPCCVQYDELPFDQKIKDYLFAAVVRAFFEASVKA